MRITLPCGRCTSGKRIDIGRRFPKRRHSLTDRIILLTDSNRCSYSFSNVSFAEQRHNKRGDIWTARQESGGQAAPLTMCDTPDRSAVLLLRPKVRNRSTAHTSLRLLPRLNREARLAAKVVFHLPEQFHQTFFKLPHLLLFQKIHEVITARGGVVEVRRRAEALRAPSRTDWSEFLDSDNLHIIENGMVQQPNALNTALAYLPRYFHLDAHGVLAESSAGSASYDENSVNSVLARSRFREFRDRFVKGRRSRYGPKKEVATLPEGCIAVFLQGDNPHRQGTAFCDNETLLRTVVANAGGRPVVVKAHPFSRQLDDAQLILKLLQDGLPLEPTDANVHDILHHCAATVSYNSAVAIEGFLHNKPAVLFGKSDFHHVSETVKNVQDFSAALEAALRKEVNYEKFLYWYFSRFALTADDRLLAHKLRHAFELVGFSEKDLGLLPARKETRKDLKELKAKQATYETQRLLRGLPEAETLKLRRALDVSETYQEFIGVNADQKLRICRHLSDNGEWEVHARVKELRQLSQNRASGSVHAEGVVFAYPDLGLLCLTHIPGAHLGQKIAQAPAVRRSKFVRMAADWLQKASLERNRKEELTTIVSLQDLRDGASQADLTYSDKVLVEDLLSDLGQRLLCETSTKVLLIEGQARFLPENLILRDGKLFGINLHGARWTAVSHTAAQFLVDLKLSAPLQSKPHQFGVDKGDLQAFLSSGLIPKREYQTILPLFVGQELLCKLVSNDLPSEVKENARAATRAFLS